MTYDGGLLERDSEDRETIGLLPVDTKILMMAIAPILRIGINTGVVVAGVIGKRKFIYDLWGDAVNIASRMKSSGEPGMIQVTEATFAKIRDEFLLEPRGVVDIKGRGKIKTYLLTGRKRDDAGNYLRPHPEARSEAEPRRAG